MEETADLTIFLSREQASMLREQYGDLMEASKTGKRRLLLGQIMVDTHSGELRARILVRLLSHKTGLEVVKIINPKSYQKELNDIENRKNIVPEDCELDIRTLEGVG